MSASYRLSRLDFNRFKVGRRLSGTHLSIAMGSIKGRAEGGFACVVSKKVARKAVDRNRIKRRVRAVVRGLFLPGPLTFIVYAKSGASQATIQELRDEITTLLRRFH